MKTKIRFTPREVATKIVASLDLGTLAYAGDPARGRYRGYGALGDLCDHNQLALDAGCPELDGTPGRLELLPDYFAAITEAIIARYTQLARVDEFASASRAVLASWESGNLASAVNSLGSVLEAYDAQP